MTKESDAIDLPEIKGMKIEPLDLKDLPRDEGKLTSLLRRIQGRIQDVQKEKLRKIQADTPEGQRTERQLEEMRKSIERSTKSQIEYFENELYQAKIDLVMRLFGEELLRSKKYILVDEDPRLQNAVYERRRLRTMLAGAELD